MTKTSPPGQTADTLLSGEKLTSREKALAAARALDELKAHDVVILDVKGVAVFTDYFVIATGDSKRHLRGLAKRLEEAAAAQGFRVHHAEGAELARWILVDLNNVIVHVFDDEARAYYELERLWGDATPVAFEP